jgi:uncharacterized repeat protein (TIGR03803 family)
MASLWRVLSAMSTKSKQTQTRRRRISGAPGRRSYRPRIDALEGRVTPADSLTHVATIAGVVTLAGPVVDSHGNLFAPYRVHDNSSGKAGGVLEVFPDGQGKPDFANFDVSVGAPNTHLVIDSSGNLYGTTDQDNVFKVTRSGGLTILGTLDSNTTGFGAGAGDLLLANGVLYGTAYGGGPNNSNNGTVFSLPAGGGKPTLLGAFNGTNGQTPMGGLILCNGILYGTTARGGAYNSGTVFSVPATGGGDIQTVADIPAGQTANPHLVMSGTAQNEYLYGTFHPDFGGTTGSFFKVRPRPHSQLVSESFNVIGFGGGEPISGLIDDGGSIIGAVSETGGKQGVGDVFRIDTDSFTVSVLRSFEHDGDSGALPFGSLSVDRKGNVYGASRGRDGIGNDTVIFWKLSGLKPAPAPPPTPRPPTIVFNEFSTQDSANLTIDYTVAHNDAETPFALDVYRSTAALWNRGKQVAVANLTILGKNAGNGPHTIVIGPGSPYGYAFLPSQPDALRPDLTHTHVLAVADSGGAVNPKDSANPPSASFQIHVIAVIAHGYSTDLASAQATNTAYAHLLQSDGYELGIPWNWASTTSVSTKKTPIQKLLPNSARDLANTVEARARQISTGNDIVDVNFIGYSRGAVLVSEVLSDIFNDNNSSKAVKQLKCGYMMETLIDPHPANNNYPQEWAGENHQYSADHGPMVDYLVAPILSQIGDFQRIVRDPNTFIPPNVRAAADFYQHTSVSELTGTEGLVNLWGEDPSLIINGCIWF